MSVASDPMAKRPRKPAAPSPDLSHIAAGLRPLAVPIGELVPDPRNALTHGDENLAAIEASFRSFGQRRPLVAQRDTGAVLVGNGRLAVARRLGWTHVAVVWVQDDPAAAAGYAIADNRTADLAEWDEALLAELVAGVRDDDADLAAALLLDDLVGGPRSVVAGEPASGDLEFHVVVNFPDEAAQERFYRIMEAEGRECRLLMS